jgi:hypothetical protein
MHQPILRGRRRRTNAVPRSLAARAAGTIVAGAAVFAASATAQASAAAPGPAMVPCRSSALVTAINQANRAGTATLQLARGCDYVLTRTVAEDDGLPPVTGKITIIGGPGTQISRARSAGLFRILEVSSGGALTLVNLTVANGHLAGVDGFDDEGAGIRNGGTLDLRHVRLIANRNDGGFGGGLYVDGGARATISDSDLDGNSATSGSGGAVFSLGDLAIDQSALAGNTADNGGGVLTLAGSTTQISRTAVNGNNATTQGGGIQNQGAMVLTGDQVTFNHAAQRGGGIFNPSPGTVTLQHTLVAFNSPDNCNPQGTIAGCRN